MMSQPGNYSPTRVSPTIASTGKRQAVACRTHLAESPVPKIRQAFCLGVKFPNWRRTLAVGGSAMDPAPSLPNDVLASVLRRLPPRGLAACRCVCKAWRGVIDGRRLLRADLLPLSVGGILLNCVVNPATRQWQLLPSRPMLLYDDMYLVFDPTQSPNYELFIVPNVPSKFDGDEECKVCEWPPSTLILPVFSSKTASWEDRTFSREGEAAGTLPAMVSSPQYWSHQSAYWRGALYICCSNCFVMRISPSDNKYQAIRMPTQDRKGREFFLRKSINGTEWLLKHDINIFSILPNLNSREEQRDGPWTLQNYNYRPFSYDDDGHYVVHRPIVEEKFEWDFDNDNVLEPGSRSVDCHIDFIGFHPCKEVVFLSDGKFDRVLAYNWSSLKLQNLGKVFTEFYIHNTTYEHYHKILGPSFPYTPCWLGELPEKLKFPDSVAASTKAETAGCFAISAAIVSDALELGGFLRNAFFWWELGQSTEEISMLKADRDVYPMKGLI
uniref:F-box domain-containing protein n=1 Tax=Leersia perrieri TaxID=77586 RepID=A0A0D9WW86_9ORYZ